MTRNCYTLTVHTFTATISTMGYPNHFNYKWGLLDHKSGSAFPFQGKPSHRPHTDPNWGSVNEFTATCFKPPFVTCPVDPWVEATDEGKCMWPQRRGMSFPYSFSPSSTHQPHPYYRVVPPTYVKIKWKYVKPHTGACTWTHMTHSVVHSNVLAPCICSTAATHTYCTYIPIRYQVSGIIFRLGNL